MSGRRSRWMKLLVLAGALMWAEAAPPPTLAQGDAGAKLDAGSADARQTVLGPGLYVFQTRTRDASCGDSEPDGYVLSFFAAVHVGDHAPELSGHRTIEIIR